MEQLWSDFRLGRNTRVPVTFACDEQVWLKVSGHTFREFYTDPGIHLKAQLEGRRWFCENVAGDMATGLPDQWVVSVQLWMEENEFLGCEVKYQENDYAWGLPLSLDREGLLDHLSNLDPDERARSGSAFKMYQALRELADGMEYAGRPVVIAPPGVSTHGVFTKAAEIRGLEAFCQDLYEAPDYASRLLDIVTEKTVGRIKAWQRLTQGTDIDLPSPDGFGCCDDSLALISAELYERAVLPAHERLFSMMTTGPRSIHLCGRASQHYETLVRKLGITHIDGPGPFVDHGHCLETLGPDLAFAAQTDNSVLAYGSEAEIDEMMRNLLTPAAKLPGRFQVVGFVTRDTALENVRACYEAGLRYGVIEKSG
ncbi:MAG: uroporphyrinogen decarboxylase family protein [Armatimonadota bacterium]|nr:uroporphyrinogen decarboxylase family protein [Armatimonadota bacterium]